MSRGTPLTSSSMRSCVDLVSRRALQIPITTWGGGRGTPVSNFSERTEICGESNRQHSFINGGEEESKVHTPPPCLEENIKHLIRKVLRQLAHQPDQAGVPMTAR